MKAVFDQSRHKEIILLGDSIDQHYFRAERPEQLRKADSVRTRYIKENINVVVPVGPGCLEYVLRHRDIMFPGIPVVFCAHSAYELHHLDRVNDVTGVGVTVDISGTIDIAMRLQPGLRRVALVAGTGLLDIYLASRARSVFERTYSGQLEWIDLSGLPMDELLARASILPEGTALLFMNLARDGAGVPFVPAEAMQMVSKSANAPLYNLLDTALGYGSVGGRLTTFEAYGRKTAEIVLRVLGGEKAASIEPVVMSDSPAMFDWRELKRWGMEESALPPGSIVRFKEFSFWEEYRWWIVGTIAFNCLLILLTSLLAINLRRRKQAESSLALSEANLKKAQEVAAIGSLSLDIQRNRVNWSAGINEIFGLPPDSELTYETFMQTVHPDDREKVKARWRAALEGEPYDQEYRILVGEREKWIRAKLQLEFGKGGKPLSATGVVQDITPRKLAAEQASRFRQQLAHVSRVSTVGEIGQNLAHEINQPLMAILANAEAAQNLLEDERPDLAEVREALGDIVMSNKRAQKVIQRIRYLVRNTQPEFTHVDLNRVALDTLEVVQTDAAAKGTSIHLDLNSDMPPVKGDPVQLQQVVLNLIVNAIEAVRGNEGQERSVTIHTAGDGDGNVNLFVSDTGPGIDPQTIKRLFDPFFTTKPQGLGLGLSISRTIVEAHGGTLGGASNLDKGATFCLHLPAAESGKRRTRSEA